MDLRQNLLKQQLQREIEVARRLEAKGLTKEASIHYIRASAIYRKLARLIPGKKEDLFTNASSYETHGNRISRIENENIASRADNLIVSEKPTISWQDIGGLEEAKQTIKEAVIIPMIREKPEFVKASKTILLYGPPGTGKTLLAKAACSMLNATFFEAKASSLLSKYFGESSKIIEELFKKAKEKQPSLIFMDEIDAIAISRSSEMNEATRRALTQLLMEIEGFKTSSYDKVVIIAATNKPWDLDDAFVSRFQRRIYVPLPDFEARIHIFKIHLKGAELADINFKELAELSEGYSGRDIANLCNEAIMVMIRKENPELGAIDVQKIDNYKLKYRALKRTDFEMAMKKIKPSVNPKSLERYKEWSERMGS